MAVLWRSNNVFKHWLLGVLALTGCYTPAYEQSAVFTELSREQSPARVHKEHSKVGSVASYVALAISRGDDLAAALEQAKAARFRTGPSTALPNPTVSVNYFLSPIETRVGPQRAKVSVGQRFPWPGSLMHAGQASEAYARSAEYSASVVARNIKAEVKRSYWHLKLLREERKVHSQHLLVLKGLVDTVVGRMATGQSSLADAKQMRLKVAMLEESLLALNNDERAAMASLQRWVAEPTNDFPTTDPWPVPTTAVGSSVASHPLVGAIRERANQQLHLAKGAHKRRFPTLTAMASWFVIGNGVSGGDGRDAFSVGVGLSIPLWQSKIVSLKKSYLAQRKSLAHEARSKENELLSLQTYALEQTSEAIRKYHLYNKELIPLAEGAFDSARGRYAAGGTNVAQLLLAQEELLRLRVGVLRAQSSYAINQAVLENLEKKK